MAAHRKALHALNAYFRREEIAREKDPPPVSAEAGAFSCPRLFLTLPPRAGMMIPSTMIRQLRTFIQFTYPYWKPYRGRLFAGIAVGIAYGLSNALAVGLSKILIQRIAPGETGPLPSGGAMPDFASSAASFSSWLQQAADTFLPLSGQAPTAWQIAGGFLILPCLVALRGALGYISSYCISWVGEHVTSDLRCTVLNKLTDLSLDYFDQAKMGDLLGRVQNDTFAIHNALERGVSDAVKEPFTLMGVLLGLIWLDWKLTILGLIFLPLFIFPIRILGKKIRRATEAGLHQVNESSSLLVESLSGIRVVKAFGLEQTIRQRFRDTTHLVRHHSMKRWQARGLTNPILETLSAAGIGLIILYVTSTQVSIANLGGFIIALGLLLAPVKKLASIHLVFKEAGVAVGRMQNLLATESSVKDHPHPGKLDGVLDEIVFENVHFQYGSDPVLRGIDLRIPSGHRLGIAGESGSGKSSLLNLLFRFYDPSAGRLLLNGRDARELSLADLRRHLALVSQDTVLFDGSVADNIACGKAPPASREEIETAARSAHAHGFITGTPQGYDTLIGERGARLSGGQRQRMAIARAFVRNAEVLVLDEATAALDAKSEEEVQQAIEQLAKNRTVICVAHRLATLRSMDEIIVLEKGRIAERGAFSELIRQGGIFAAMAQKQGVKAGD